MSGQDQKITVCIYTNCHKFAPSAEILKQTYISFLQTFDPASEIPVRIYIDPHPDVGKLKKYREKISDTIPGEITITESLSDGYLRSLDDCKTPFIFQLEGDWLFNGHEIKHSLAEIIDFMQAAEVYHFRFNKRENKAAVWDKVMKPGNLNSFKFCRSNNMSNNPHIIDREWYNLDVKKYIAKLPGSKGIEERLNQVGKYESILYGGAGHPATVTHIDGRDAWRGR